MREATSSRQAPASEAATQTLILSADTLTVTLPHPHERSMPRASLWLFALAACLVPLGYALYTEHIWEDFFITFRYSQNLIDGAGLVYHAGERVHGFTSPLGVLLPALTYLVTGKSSYLAALWLFRLLSIAAFAGGGVLLVQCLYRANPERPLLAWFFALLYLLEVKAVAYTINGMETGFMLLFLAWGVSQFVAGSTTKGLARGACWAGLMWTRPDGCVYIAGLAVAEFLFCQTSWKALLASLLRSAGVCTLLYLPWFLWAWNYYGTPVPHTVIAKSFVEDSALSYLLSALKNLPEKLPQTAGEIFRPIYASTMEGWFDTDGLNVLVARLTKAAGLFCAGYWLLPLNDRLGRMASFCFLVLVLYFSYLYMPFPWYYPPATILGLLVFSRGVLFVADAIRAWLPHDALYAHSRLAAGVVLGVFSCWHVVQFGLISWQMKVQMEEIELGNRAQIGHWLRAHAEPTDRVYLEPVGYIGYFSGLRIVDYPGLVAPDVVRLRREQQLSMAGIVTELLPEWAILRPGELEALKAAPNWEAFQKHYTEVRVFDVVETISQYDFLPGRAYLWTDVTYHIFQRQTAIP